MCLSWVGLCPSPWVPPNQMVAQDSGGPTNATPTGKGQCATGGPCLWGVNAPMDLHEGVDPPFEVPLPVYSEDQSKGTFCGGQRPMEGFNGPP